jgi:hypothetical protein
MFFGQKKSKVVQFLCFLLHFKEKVFETSTVVLPCINGDRVRNEKEAKNIFFKFLRFCYKNISIR